MHLKFNFIRYPFLLSILILCKISSYSQTGSIRGYVTDTINNENFIFVNVMLVDTKFATSTDTLGNFEFINIPNGIYKLKVISLGYPEYIIDSISVKGGSLSNFNISYPPPCPNPNNSKTCPKCNKTNKVIPIKYGLPGKRMMAHSKREKIHLGGCLIMHCNPHWYCKKDKIEF